MENKIDTQDNKNTQNTQQIELISTENIKTNPFQPRQNFEEEEIIELSKSIKLHGVLQPLIVRKIDNTYQLVAGERRLRACKFAGLETVPAVILDVDGLDVAEISIVENIQRKNLNCLEEANAYYTLSAKFALTHDEIAERLGKSRPHISNTMRLLNLSDYVKEALYAEKISMGHGRALLAVESPEIQDEILKKIIANNYSVRQTEDLVKLYLQSDNKSSSSRKKRQKFIKLFQDARIYFNEIKRVLKEIKAAGGNAEMIERETENHLELLIRIPKAGTIFKDD